jgi:predicted nuclease of restriction endonuclease-like (RecB) superfamily
MNNKIPETNELTRFDGEYEILSDIKELIDRARERTARTVNSELVLLYWHVGRRLLVQVLNRRRACYGQKILPTLSAKLVPDYGPGFGPRNLARMIHFAEAFPSVKKVAELSGNLGWSHLVEILPLEEKLKRDFYVEMCRHERWGIRTLRAKIAGMLFERTVISKKPDRLIAMELKKLHDRDKLTPDLVFRDPYFLDFLKLKGAYQEKDLESAIIREMEAFILELGVGFAFVARQKRIQIGPDDFYLDLLFYHRKLKCQVAIELKLDKFKAEHKGQMELYLAWLEKHERQAGEHPPLGLILCASKSSEQVELLQLKKSRIHLAHYLNVLPPRRTLEKKLHEVNRIARERYKVIENA